MKKLIYMFLFGLVFVACDKNELPEVAAVAEIHNITIDQSEIDVDAIIGSLLENLSDYANSKSKKGTNAGKGQDFVAIHIFSDAGVRYLTLLDETNDDLCFGDTTVATVFFDNSAGDGSVLSVEDTNGTVSVELVGNFAAFFSAGQNTLVKLNSNNKSIGQIDFDEANSATFE